MELQNRRALAMGSAVELCLDRIMLSRNMGPKAATNAHGNS